MYDPDTIKGLKTATADGKKILLEDFYHPPRETLDFIYDTYTQLIQWRSLREQPYKQFNNQTMTDYIDEARKKFWGYLPLASDVDTPQFFLPDTRDQIIQVLSRIANLKMKPTFDGVKGFDVVTATVMNDLFEVWRRGANRKISNFWQFLYCVLNGTVIVYTGYNSKIRKVKNITKYDAHTGETEWKEEEIDESDVEDVICNLEDIYVPKIWVPANQIQDQDEIIWRTLIKWKDFKNAFKGYSNHEYVVPGSQFSDSSIFADFLSYDVMGSDFVEVIKKFNGPKDQYGIIANGVLLNPITDRKTKKEEISPLPWNHKKLPFSGTIFEPLDPNFFYGMPLAQKVKSAQEAVNMFVELGMRREIKSVDAPIITNDPSIEDGLEFKSGNIYQVQAPVDQFKELGITGTGQSTWNWINFLRGSLAKSGSGGVGPLNASVQPRSATDISKESQDKEVSASLYYMFYQDLLEQKAWITIKNFIQFYTAAKTEMVLGGRKFKKILSIAEQTLWGGGIGSHEVRITDNPASAKELKKESYLRSIFKKERVDIIETTPDALRKVDFDLKINFEPEQSPSEERIQYLDFITTIMNLFGNIPGLLSPKKIFYRLLEKNNEPIGDFVDPAVESDYENDRFGIAPKQQPQSPQDRVNAALQGGGGQDGGQDQGGGSPQPNNIPGLNAANQGMRGMQMGAQGPASRMKKGGQILKKF